MNLWGRNFVGVMLLAIAMLSLQSISINHEIEHEGTAHSHDGMLCVLDIFQDRDDDALKAHTYTVASPKTENIYLLSAPALTPIEELPSWASPRAPPRIL